MANRARTWTAIVGGAGFVGSLALTALAGCGGRDSEPSGGSPVSPVSAGSAGSASSARARGLGPHGGKVAAAGSSRYEIVMRSDGLVQAYPVSGSVPADMISVELPTVAGRLTRVELAAGEGGTFVGRAVDGAPRAGNVVVEFTRQGVTLARADLSDLPLEPVAARGGAIVDVGLAKLELVIGTNGVVQAYPIYPTVEAQAALPGSASVAAEIAVAGGERVPVVLAWLPALGIFEGEVDGDQPIVEGAARVRVARGTEVAEVESPSLVPRPSHALVVDVAELGGVAVTLDDGTRLEVAVGDDGLVVAEPLVTSVTTPIVEPDGTVTVDAVLDDGVIHPIALVWQGPDAGFRGQLPPGIDATSGPLDVRVTRSGGRGQAIGRVARVVVAPAASLRGRLTALAAHGRRAVVRAMARRVDEANETERARRPPASPGNAPGRGAVTPR